MVTPMYADIDNHRIQHTIQAIAGVVEGTDAQVVYAALLNMIYMILVGADGTHEGMMKFSKTLSEVAVMEVETLKKETVN